MAGFLHGVGLLSRGRGGSLFRAKGIMCKQECRDIQENVMLPFVGTRMARKWIFRQDNDPKHSFGLAKDWFVDW